MATEMSWEKMIKRGKLIRKMSKLFYKIKSIKSVSRGKERFVETSRGMVRVLEYGFDSDAVTPLHMDMHGGGFLLMNADADEAMNLRFRESAGVKVISIDYPKAPEHPFPIAAEAIYEVALHYIENASVYGIDPERIGIGGHSAGANLAAVTCLRDKANGGHRFRYQILDYPPLDLYTDPFSKPNPPKAIPPKLAAIFNACYVEPENAKNPYASPVFASEEHLLGLPPAMIIVAGFDSLHNEGVCYGNMLKKAGVEVELHDFKNSVHGFTYQSSTETDRACMLMAEFIVKNTR